MEWDLHLLLRLWFLDLQDFRGCRVRIRSADLQRRRRRRGSRLLRPPGERRGRTRRGGHDYAFKITGNGPSLTIASAATGGEDAKDENGHASDGHILIRLVPIPTLTNTLITLDTASRCRSSSC